MQTADKKNPGSRPHGKDNNDTGLAIVPRMGLEGIFEGFFRPFDDFFPPAMRSFVESQTRQPILDFQDRGDHYSVTAELPGFDKDEVEVKVDSNGLELKAEKTEKSGEKGAQSTSSRSYYQYVSLPDQVVTEKIDGTMKNGILELKLPKRVSKLKETSRRVDLK